MINLWLEKATSEKKYIQTINSMLADNALRIEEIIAIKVEKSHSIK